jgi:hypothetical protein
MIRMTHSSCFAALLGAFALASPFHRASAQDLAVVEIEAPRDGCALGATENVSLSLFNYGPNLPAGSSFNVSYSINAGAPATEFVVLGSTLLANSRFDYTFTTPADLSVPGTYTIDATVNLRGDFNPSNDAYTGYHVVNTSPRVAGTLVGPAPPSTSGTLTLGGSTGPIAQWEESVDGGLRWFALANTSTTQDFADLRTPTKFRVRMQGAPCGPDVLSNVVVVSP